MNFAMAIPALASNAATIARVPPLAAMGRSLTGWAHPDGGEDGLVDDRGQLLRSGFRPAVDHVLEHQCLAEVLDHVRDERGIDEAEQGVVPEHGGREPTHG